MESRVLAVFAAAALLLSSVAQAATVTLLNVSYDPTRELYKQIDAAFIADWTKAHPGTDLVINQSHSGSGAQSRAVIDGLDADVVTLALAYDIDAIAAKGLIAKNWQSRLPQNATPYTSTIVFLVRKGNPWKIRDWPDLIKPGIQVITPNPKTSGGARWAFLAAWAYALKAPGGSPDKAKAFVAALYHHVPVLDTGARGSTTTFAQRGIGDVLLSWENEAHLALKEQGGDQFQIVYPPVSIRAEPPVAVVDKNVDKHNTREVATAYLNFLYSKAAQEIEAKNFYRPRDAAVLAAHAADFPKLTLYDFAEIFGDWQKAQATFFADKGVFDQIYKPGQ
ncbi:MAG TPA: sulfate ABC transporter substrate-binding protein [Rhizomicrobium sp.]|nr:sulfate ABC transporter substrate-binding protein [Rhizomicrobium sp.]